MFWYVHCYVYYINTVLLYLILRFEWTRLTFCFQLSLFHCLWKIPKWSPRPCRFSVFPLCVLMRLHPKDKPIRHQGHSYLPSVIITIQYVIRRVLCIVLGSDHVIVYLLEANESLVRFRSNPGCRLVWHDKSGTFTAVPVCSFKNWGFGGGPAARSGQLDLEPDAGGVVVVTCCSHRRRHFSVLCFGSRIARQSGKQSRVLISIYWDLYQFIEIYINRICPTNILRLRSRCMLIA